MLFVLLLLTLSLSYSLQIEAINAQVYSKIDYMKKIEDFPEELSGNEVKSLILQDSYPRGALYIGRERLEDRHLKDLLKRANVEALTPTVRVKFGWTLRRTYMKLLPTDESVHMGDPDIDYNQYTLLEPLTPLAILHTSLDGEWLYVHAPFMRGWVKTKDVLLSSKEELKRLLSLKFLVVLKDRVRIGGVEFGIGARVPYLEKQGNMYRIFKPDGQTLWIERDESLSDGFLSYSEGEVKRLLESLLETPYGWGGLNGNKDCSALVRDVFSVFGLELPRNSAQQMQIGRVVATSFESYEEMEDLLKALPPFRTLVFLKGHVMVYGGMEGDDLIFYHAVHSITQDNGKRIRVGKVVKSKVKSDRLTKLHKRIISVNLLE